MSGVTTSRMRKREQKMKRIMWANPMIKSAGYDAQQQMLEIEFANNGQIWQFDNVPEDIWYRFRSHHLPELFFHNFIMGHYPERRMQEIERGNQAAEAAAESLEQIVTGVKEIAADSRRLSEESTAQAQAMEQAEVGVTQISEVVQSNSASAEESSATSEELSAQAYSLNEVVGKFTLRRD